MHCPVKSVLKLIGNTLNLSYVFIVFCTLISAWHFVAFLTSGELNGSLKNPILYCSVYSKRVLLSCSCRNALSGMPRVREITQSIVLSCRSVHLRLQLVFVFIFGHKFYI